jgi:proton-translocating NAD(P)+ transhydrogenase subunit alpha
MSQSPSTFKVFGLMALAILLGGLLFAQDDESASPSDVVAADKVVDTEEAKSEEASASGAEEGSEPKASEELASDVTKAAVATQATPPRAKTVDYAFLQRLFLFLTIFVLAVFLGIELISKVPPTLHTPLMSGANAISGITLVGAVIVAASISFSGFVGFIAVTLATVNAVGGFMVTHRMLAMFKKR